MLELGWMTVADRILAWLKEQNLALNAVNAQEPRSKVDREETLAFVLE